MKIRQLLISIKKLLLFVGIILILFTIVRLYFFMNKKLHDTDYAFIFDYSYHILEDNNLKSEYNKNDLLIIKKAAYYNTGDTVLYKTNGTYKIAKIYDFSSKYYYITDDTAFVNNNIIQDTDIIGKVASSISYFGILIKIITSWPIIILGIIFIILYAYLTLTEERHIFP